MIGRAAQDGLGAVELFEQHYAGHFVRERHGAESQLVLCTLQDGTIKAVCTAYDEAGGASGVLGEAFEERGEIA